MLFLPLEEQGQQTTASPRSSPPETAQKQVNSGSFNCSTSSALNVKATLATCVECQLEAGYLR
jgi:hypothetical protein